MIKVLKGFSKLGAFLILIVGLFMTGITVYGYVRSQLLFNQYTLLGIILGADLLILIGAVIGILGIKRGNGFLICIFQIFVLIFLIVFLGIGIGAELLPQKVFDGECNKSSNQLIQIANNAFEYSAANLCQSNCSCALTDDAINNGNYTEVQKIQLKYQLVRNGPAYKFQQCSAAEDLDQDYQNMFNVLYSIEETLDCSEWCQGQRSNLFYKFSDVNRGRPESYCYNTMKQKLDSYGHIIGLSAFGVALFLLLVGLSNLYICCSPDRRSLSYRERFVYNDDGNYRHV